MPPVSQAQRRAMQAAKSGKSTIGIPKKVGAEFSKADKGGKLPEKKGAVDRSAHWKGNPGFPSSPEAGESPPPISLQPRPIPKGGLGAGSFPHEDAENASILKPLRVTEPVVMTERTRSYNTAPKREGRYRLSGNPGAHRLGRK